MGSPSTEQQMVRSTEHRLFVSAIESQDTFLAPTHLPRHGNKERLPPTSICWFAHEQRSVRCIKPYSALDCCDAHPQQCSGQTRKSSTKQKSNMTSDMLKRSHTCLVYTHAHTHMRMAGCVRHNGIGALRLTKILETTNND